MARWVVKLICGCVVVVALWCGCWVKEVVVCVAVGRGKSINGGDRTLDLERVKLTS